MKWLYRLEYKYGKFCISNLILYIIIGMAMVYVTNLVVPEMNLIGWMSFDRALIFQGQVWRILTFIFVPPAASPLWIIFSLLFYFTLGTQLDRQWGSFKFCVYYFIGLLCTMLAGFIVGYVTNTFLNYSLLFAFAMLFPDLEFLIFFFIPVKVKWIALLEALSFAVAFIFGGIGTKLVIIAAVANFLIFFGGNFWNKIRDFFKYRKRRKAFRREIRK